MNYWRESSGSGYTRDGWRRSKPLAELNPKLRRNSKGTSSLWGTMEPQIMALKPSNFETQFWPPGDPEGVGQRIFDHRMHLFRAPLARNPLLDILGSLPQRPLSQAEETFAWWEGKQTGGNDAVPWALSNK